MQTTNNFNALSFIKPSARQVFVYIFIQYGGVRKFARLLGVSDTAVHKWLRAPDLYPKVHQRIISEFGFDPFRQ